MFENLVFSGGGIKCIAYLGVFKFLEENNMIKDIKNICATSGGSLFALILILGYKYDDILSLILELDFNHIRDINSNNIFQFFNNYGIDTGNNLEHLIQILLDKKCNNKNITFLELYKQFPINLIVTGTCINNNSLCFFNYKTNPNMPVYLAIRISCSIPIVFNYVKYNNCIYVDGGILGNYPIDYFKDNLEKTIGFYINSDNTETTCINSIDTYILNIIFSITNKLENNIINNQLFKYKTIRFDCDFYSIDYNISRDLKIKTINCAYKTICSFFKKINTKILGIDNVDINMNDLDMNELNDLDMNVYFNNSKNNTRKLNNIIDISNINITNVDINVLNNFTISDLETLHE